MIKSSTRLGVGHFFFETADPVAAVLLCRCSEFVSSRALRAQKCCKNFSKNSEKFGKIRENAPDPTFIGRARGGPHLFWGLHDILFCIKGPHIIDSLKSKNFSNFFLKNVKNQKIFSREFENFRRRAAIITLPNFLSKIFENS